MTEATIDQDLKGWLDIIQERIEYLLSIGDYKEAARVILKKAGFMTTERRHHD